ncbi:MAG: Cytochrome oxidase, cbb3-type, subunit [Pseudomonadota bacterium]
MRLSRLVLVSTLALAGCGGTDTPGTDAGTDAGAQTRTQQIAALTGSVTAGGNSFANRGCAACHGANGAGTGSGVALQAPLKDESKEEIIGVLLNGVSGTSMSSYAGLEDQELADLYAYMKAEFGK